MQQTPRRKPASPRSQEAQRRWGSSQQAPITGHHKAVLHGAQGPALPEGLVCESWRETEEIASMSVSPG